MSKEYGLFGPNRIILANVKMSSGDFQDPEMLIPFCKDSPALKGIEDENALAWIKALPEYFFIHRRTLVEDLGFAVEREFFFAECFNMPKKHLGSAYAHGMLGIGIVDSDCRQFLVRNRLDLDTHNMHPELIACFNMEPAKTIAISLEVLMSYTKAFNVWKL